LEEIAGIAAGALDNARLLDEIQHRAIHDPLTDLPTKVLFLDRFEHAFGRRPQTGRWLAVMFLDLDQFKVINDSLGHDTDDQVLLSVAARLRESLRPGDTAARLGGDEFAVLCEQVEETLLQAADTAMYRAMARGRVRHLTSFVNPRLRRPARPSPKTSYGRSRTISGSSPRRWTFWSRLLPPPALACPLSARWRFSFGRKWRSATTTGVPRRETRGFDDVRICTATNQSGIAAQGRRLWYGGGLFSGAASVPLSQAVQPTGPVRLGAVILRTDPAVALTGRRCVPTRLLDAYPTLEDALSRNCSLAGCSRPDGSADSSIFRRRFKRWKLRQHYWHPLRHWADGKGAAGTLSVYTSSAGEAEEESMAILMRTAGLIVSIAAFVLMGAGGVYWLVTQPCQSGHHRRRHLRSEQRRPGDHTAPFE